MTDPNATLRAQANNSGFLFQLAVEHAVRESSAAHGWQVRSREHAWEGGGDSGYADLIVGRHFEHLVIECKRPREATWLFLCHHRTQRRVSRVRAHWHGPVDGDTRDDGWSDYELRPYSPEAEFCIVRGQGEGEQPMLERMSSGLVTSIQPLAAEQGWINSKAGDQNFELVYVPCIVTTARLAACFVDPADISISNGTLTSGEFETVPWIRFRKSLATSISDDVSVRTIADAARDKERTVLIVSAEHIVEFLTQWQIEPPNGWQLSPLQLARRRFAFRQA